MAAYQILRSIFAESGVLLLALHVIFVAYSKESFTDWVVNQHGKCIEIALAPFYGGDLCAENRRNSCCASR